MPTFHAPLDRLAFSLSRCPKIRSRRNAVRGNMITSNFERLLNRQEASAFLNELGYKTAVASLNKLASTGGGPKFRKFGRKPLYSPTDLVAWAEARTSPPVRSVTEAEMIR